ncbi:hypothetical protein HPB49_021935 [Dermacentor silvarum]|uniref:Uncharacterized protein n=1 Tax=Dermacentor silvarum TaxID=543639 RepID=A0ACB8D012_DERSI|nr:hypothetical protein HPB49_021935 [Dermacentor silvarum]
MEPTNDVKRTSNAKVPQAEAEKRKKARSRTSKHGSPEPRGPMRRAPDEREDFGMRPPDAGVRVHTARLPCNRKGERLRPVTSEGGVSPTGPPHGGPSGACINDPATAAGTLPLSPLSQKRFLGGAQSPSSSMSQSWSTGSPGALASAAGFLRRSAFRPPHLPQDPSYEVTPKPHLACGTLCITLCALTTVVLATLVTMVILKSSWHSAVPLSSACATHACLAYSRRLLSSINESANPCKSFTRFVCDGWRKERSGTVWEDRFHHVLDKLTDSLKDIRVSQSGQNEEQRAAAVYRSCVSLLEGVRDELPAVQKALDDAGIVWPHPSADADVLYTLMYCSLKLGWDVLLDFDIVANSSSSMVELIADPGRLFSFLHEKHMRCT